MDKSVRRVRRTRLASCALFIAVAVVSGCEVNQPLEGLAPADRLSIAAVPASNAMPTGVPYGPDPLHRLDVYRPPGPQKGTFVYFHSGGWIGGSRSEITPFIRSVVSEGYALVSVDYRLAPTVRYREILADADRALRFTRANAARLGLDVSTLVVSGSSAGGYIAAMLGAVPGLFADPSLPPELKSVSPEVNAVVNQVGPSNLDDLWRAGDLASSISDALLGCAAGDHTSTYPRCAPNEARLASPWFWASLVAWFKGSLPPIYSAYGAVDGLVPPATQGRPLMDAWEQGAGFARAYYDNPPSAGHSLDSDLNRTVFLYWLAKVRDRTL